MNKAASVLGKVRTRLETDRITTGDFYTQTHDYAVRAIVGAVSKSMPLNEIVL